MLILRGQQAPTSFKLQRQTEALRRHVSDLQTLQCFPLYFVDTDSSLSQDALNTLETLLEATLIESPALPGVMVVPRFGTISPWSSKATDILAHCGLETIRRVEQGVCYQCLNGAGEFFVPVRAGIDAILSDPLTQTVLTALDDAERLFNAPDPAPMESIEIQSAGIPALEAANRKWGLALTPEDMTYLFDSFQTLGRNPNDVELMMFAQVNSEHCRHKIFNASWEIDGKARPETLFKMIRNTHAKHPDGVLSAYSDNAAILKGPTGGRFFPDPVTRQYTYHEEPIHAVIKVETHNHPTAIAPNPGAATGAGGEIRDEAATGRGACTKAGLTGFAVSHLQLPTLPQPWESALGKPEHIASALTIMLEAPIGAAAFNNEFGRPNLTGFFRTFLMAVPTDTGTLWRGYHKPMMIAGGLGNIRDGHTYKNTLPENAQIIVLGGPAMAIGLGGGAASSMGAGESDPGLDYASVQRSNPEMQRRCQEVINQCWALGEENPILSIHDVGAGGLSNAVPELVDQSDLGGRFELQLIPAADPSLSPLALWCNESQERYVLGVALEDLPRFEAIAARERCPFAVIGQTTLKRELILENQTDLPNPIELPAEVILGDPPKLFKRASHHPCPQTPFDHQQLNLKDAVERVLQLPTVASKAFLITIGDRTVGGLTARDQCVGPWQVPVADVAVTASGFQSDTGEAMAMGERAPLAIRNAAASARMAVGEAITNLIAADVADLSDINLSANWMAASGVPGEDAKLFEAVEAIGMALCPTLKICIPVGKDSLSMQMRWEDKHVVSPLSLVITAFAQVQSIRQTLTPQLHLEEPSVLLLIDLGKGQHRLGGSALAQVYSQLGEAVPDLNDPSVLVHCVEAMRACRQKNLIHAYHDRSDGGVLVTLAEMAFASRCGFSVALEGLGDDPLASLFNEELGAVIQVKQADLEAVMAIFHEHGLAQYTHPLGQPTRDQQLTFKFQEKVILSGTRSEWQQAWASTSFHLQALRDNPACAQAEFDLIAKADDPGLHCVLSTPLPQVEQPPAISKNRAPQVAILREQGVNGHLEMAAAFDAAGFDAIDVPMQDLIDGKASLTQFQALAACGGFSYGDVLGAGRGWANAILHHGPLREMFTHFFERPDTLTLGVCNGCQMLSHLKTLIPGSAHWPQFLANTSAQYEARFSLTKVLPSPSIFFDGLAGSQLPIVVSHGEGRAHWADLAQAQACLAAQLAPLAYVGATGEPTLSYPANPNGSEAALTAFTTEGGRATIMMPHPERVFRTTQWSWHPPEWGEFSPWLHLFLNARKAFD